MAAIPTIRPASADDAHALAVVGAATLLEAFAGFIPGHALLAHCAKYHRAEAYATLFEQPQTRAWLAEVDPGSAPVGYCVLTAPDFPAELLQHGDSELRRIYLFSRFHGTGTARALTELAIAEARRQRAGRLLLGVHPENYRALAFYAKTGFARIGTRSFQVGTLQFHDPVLALTL